VEEGGQLDGDFEIGDPQALEAKRAQTLRGAKD
jgi:hypothetical protein